MASPVSLSNRCPYHPVASSPDAPGARPAKPAAAGNESPRTGSSIFAERDVFTPAPTTEQVASSPEKRSQAAEKIPCPALATLFTQGMLPAADDGTVKIAELDETLTKLGIDSGLRKILTRGADKVDGINGEVNLFKLNGSSLDHTGSTGIRQNGVHPERFEDLASFSADGRTLRMEDFARAANAFAEKDPGLRGTAIQTLEFSLILQVFGRRDEKGQPYFTLEDARKLWLRGELPEPWRPQTVGLHSVLSRAAQMGLERIFG